MNNSILMLAAGVVIGFTSALLIATANEHDQPTSSNQLDEISRTLDSLNDTAADLQYLIQKFGHLLPPAPSAAITNNTQTYIPGDTNTTGVEDNNTNTVSIPMPSTTMAPQTTEAIPPTEEQIKQYNSIEARLDAASNVKSTNLSALMQDANQLTKKQREELTNKAMQMIQNDEITPAQFNPQFNPSSGY